MIGILAAALAAWGTYLLYTALALRWKGLGFGPSPTRNLGHLWSSKLIEKAGLQEAKLSETFSLMAVFGLGGALIALLLFGAPLPALLAFVFGACIPILSFHTRRSRQRAAALQAWPRLLEELRLRTGSLGRSIPQALFEVGRRAPEELRGAFAEAEREWLLTTDFTRTTEVLRSALHDSTADAVCETLAVAHELGGGDLDRRLEALVEDRLMDLEGRKDAETKQAGVRFARRFVLIVPLGMALAGMSIGDGRAAYQTSLGQLAVAVALLSVVVCWAWSGRLMRLPQPPRVFRDHLGTGRVL